MRNTFKYAALSIALAVMPVHGHADTIGYSFEVWERVCRPSAEVPANDAAECFVEALDFYVVEFAPKAFRFGSELHCEDSVEHFWIEIDGARDRFKGFILPTNYDWRYVVSQLMHYSGQICPDISQ